jgi:hypothetical protein
MKIQYAVINPDGTFAGVPCESYEEARELAAAKEGRVIFHLRAFVECPAGDFTCPYYQSGACALENPAEECDEYGDE